MQQESRFSKQHSRFDHWSSQQRRMLESRSSNISDARSGMSHISRQNSQMNEIIQDDNLRALLDKKVN